MEQYRELVRRVQTRHGITRPKVPFSFQDVTEYMDLKKSEWVIGGEGGRKLASVCDVIDRA